MDLAFGDWQAIEVRANAALEHGIAIKIKVMGCDGGGNRVAGCLHKSNGIGCSDMLKHDLEAGEIAYNLTQDARR